MRHQTSLSTVVAIMAAAAMLIGTAAAAKLGELHSSTGSTFEVDAYAGGVMRLRVRRPTTSYEVTDVVLATPLPDSSVTVAYPDTQSATVSQGESQLTLSLATDGVVNVGFSVKGSALTTASLSLTNLEGTFRFPDVKRFYGIPEHAVDLALQTDKSYRLMNLDVFQYKLDDTGGIYGTIPFLMAHGQSHTTGILWLNSADTTVHILGPVDQSAAPDLGARWVGEGNGITDVFFFPGSTPFDVHRQHSSIVGPTMLPPQFALGYHQCRWNYRSSNDCLEVDNNFDKHNIPYDVLWLDIEHTDGKRYFTWDVHNFPEPKKLIDTIASHGRKMVTITDPHIKRDGAYHVHAEATAKGFYVKTEGGSDFEGHCWPGQSSWVDFYNADARAWYATLFKYDRYTHSTPDLYTWIDMNEPSVFNAHEVTMDKNAVHQTKDGVRVAHRDLHNMYGYYHTMAAHQGHILRNEPKPTRPFILTRSFFSGSQRYAAMWTGDNAAEWGHLEKSLPMLLTLSLSNYAFVGADVGGFFGNPEEELAVRWYQAGTFYPFFRGHAHLETKRREPWLFGDAATVRIRDAIAMRYHLMPYIYSAFFRAHDRGLSLIRPLFYDYPKEERFFTEQNAYMFGPSLLVRPIVAKGESAVTIPLPSSDLWFEFPSGQPIAAGSTSHSISVTMETVPAYIRAGSIVPARDRLRRSTATMRHDPFTLYVALREDGTAEGELYLDDDISFDYTKGQYLLKKFTFANGVLSISDLQADSISVKGTLVSPLTIERIILFNYKGTATTALLTETKVPEINGFTAPARKDASLVVTPSGAATIIRRPDAFIAGEWSLKL